jgi:hypothetical protein
LLDSFGADGRGHKSAWELLQFGVLCLGLLQDGDVRVGVFPEREEILIGRLGLGGVALHGVGASETEMCKGALRIILYDAPVLQDSLKFRGRFLALAQEQVRKAAQIGGVKGIFETKFVG